MSNAIRSALVTTVIAGVALPAAARGDAPADGSWPSFRGPRACGIAEGHATPTRWNVDRRENVRWRTEIEGLAHSSPVVWGDRIYLTTAVGAGDAPLKVGLYGDGTSVDEEGEHRFRVLCLRTADGSVAWERTAHRGVPKIKRHPKSSHANSTPACNGTAVVAFFGSEGLYCFEPTGEQRWSQDLGTLNSSAPKHPDLQWGFASSPIIHDDLVIVQCDVEGDSFLAAFDLHTGAERWRTPRDEGPTWGTPTVDVRPERRQVILNGYRHIGGYDLRTGAELWKLVGGGDVPVPTPVVAHDLIFVTNAHGPQAPIYAVKVTATGTVTDAADDEQMAWSTRRRGNYMQTPLVYGDELYCCHDTGVLTCYDARTGEQHYRERLGTGRSGFSASAVAADGKVYVSSEDGEVHVIRAGRIFELLAVNDLGETCMATPAISAGVMYFRTRHHLVAIAEQAAGADAARE